MEEVLEEVKRVKEVECVEEKDGSSSDDDAQNSVGKGKDYSVKAAGDDRVDDGASLIEAAATAATSIEAQSQLPDSDSSSSSSSDHDHAESGEI